MSAGIFLWEEQDGTRKWEAYASWNELKPLIETQLSQGADPAKMMLSVGLNWMFPGTHKGRKTVWMNDILDICNHVFVGTTASPLNMPPQHEESELGWISPDGRFFPCVYGEHTEKAREIVKCLNLADDVDDAPLYLEENCWLAVYKNPVEGKSLAIGMGKSFHRISSQQLRTLQSRGITSKIENLATFL